MPVGTPHVSHPGSGSNRNSKDEPSGDTEFSAGPAAMRVSNPCTLGGGAGMGGGDGGLESMTNVPPVHGWSPPSLPSTTVTRAYAPGRWLWNETRTKWYPFSATSASSKRATSAVIRRALPDLCTTSNTVFGVGGASRILEILGGLNTCPADSTYSRATLETKTFSSAEYPCIAALTSRGSTPPPLATRTHEPAVFGRSSAVTVAVTPGPRLPLTATSSHSAFESMRALAASRNDAWSVSGQARATSSGSTTSDTVKLKRHAPSPAERSEAGSSATSSTSSEAPGRPSACATASRTTSRRSTPAARSALKLEASYP